MITAKEALAIGKTIVAGMGRETARHPAGSREWLAARGAALNSIEADEAAALYEAGEVVFRARWEEIAPPPRQPA